MIKTVFSLAIVAALVGCAGGTQQTNERRSITYSSGMKIARPAAATALPAQPEMVRAVVVGAGEDGVSLGIVYFDFDRSEVKPQYLVMLNGVARKLKDNPAMKLSLEGHTDEAGSREYNVALGQRRSEAVRQVFLRSGVPQAQLEAVSYGEEKPAMAGDSAEAGRKNRRAEIRTKQ